MPNEARQKLRDMGGIMASSPELMQAVQKFNNGGPIMPPAPPAMRRPMMPFPLRSPVLTDDYFFAPFRRGELPTQSKPDVLPGVDRNVSLRGDVANSPEVRRQVLAASAPSFGGSRTIGSVDRIPVPDPVLELAEASEGSRARALEIENMRKKGVKAAADFVMSLPDPVQSLSQYADIFGSELAGTIASFIGATDTGAKFFDIAKEKRREDFGLPVEDMTSPMGGPRRGRPQSVADDMTSPMGGPRLGRPQSAAERRLDTTDDQRAAATRAALPDIANIEDDTAPAPSGDETTPDETLPPMITNDPEGTASEALSSLDKSYEEKLALFQKVFGDGDEDKSRDRAMSLAMIGLAIAAGQSPNALTNIAQGAMVGLNAMGEQRKERQAKREKTKALALDAALKEQEANQAFIRDLYVKGLNTSNYTEKTKDIETPLGKITVMLPTAEAAARGVEPQLLTAKDLDRQFKTKVEEKNRFMGMTQEAIGILDKPGDTVAGIGGATLRMMQSFNNAGLIPDAFYQRITGLSKGEVSDATKFDVIMTNMAAQLAPMLLGESGRTISDGDRARVADQLGVSYDPASVNDGVPGLTITGFSNVAVKGESGLRERLTRIQGLLDSSYQPVFDTYKQYNPSGYNDYMKSLEEEQSGPARVTYDETGKRVQ